MLTLSTPEKLQETQKQLRAEIKPPAVEMKNVGLATNMEADALLQYRQVRYIVRPVPYPVGLELQEIHIHIDKLGDIEEKAVELKDADQLHLVYEQLLAVMDRGRNLFHTLVKPEGLGRRMFWRWLSNPFQNCSQTEFGELLNFFSQCRTRSSIIVLASSAHRASLSSVTLPTTLPPSSRPSGPRRG